MRRGSLGDGSLWALLVGLSASGLGCGGGGGRVQTPSPEVVGNEAVRARLTALPALPIAPSLEVRRASASELHDYCVWEARAIGGYDVEAECRDGSTAHIAAACSDEDMAAMREGLLECPMTVGEWAACVAARRGAPCDGGTFGERLSECEAFASCIAAAMAASEAPGSAEVPPESKEPSRQPTR
jgi:hypothetical protein